MKTIFCILMFAAICAFSLCAGADAAVIGVNVRVGDKVLRAELEDNAATRALVKLLPLKLPMDDLYDREMCYHLKDALPTENLRSDGYQVGDIIYWPPRHSLAIMYRQNGEEFGRQHLGRIRSGVEIFERTGDAEVTFEKAD